ncbi:Uncharacterized protein dnl_62830 [Desulfonema limicola]|uniref:Uncharacterized protein n=1 Tax=Desulfonema limicola TaxID=45656 RepID=A0A975GJU3_9BACT|nr:Uncharacterized protein dnl_62830 [Desulfonema limicola]
MIIFFLRAFAALLLLLSIPAGFYYESLIQTYIPSYSSQLFFSGMICFTGLIYSLLARNLFLAFITIMVTIALPWLAKWFWVYWPL